MDKRILVIGLGRFGKSVVQELCYQGVEVIACDTSEENLQEVKEYCDVTILGNAKENSVLDDLDIARFNSVFVAIGEATDSAIYITKKLKDRSAREIVAKASDLETGEILEAVGADIVIYPEEEAGKRAAKQITSKGILEYITFSETVSGIEVQVPADFWGKTLNDLKFTKKYGLTVSLLLRDGEPFSGHIAFEELMPTDCFLIVGDNKKIDKFKAKYCG
ncbi:TrkA family potassium uptake protein (plasmid) [Rossellomorea sp. AcN35-11]|nr:TrkA family potassium uptake protein [Rossellomorea aquimaris]WJV32122.1 TrkA family potassium uptake protein [Rossellomorea sp. AcN35-11]